MPQPAIPESDPSLQAVQAEQQRPAVSHTGHLVPDIRDRNPFAADWAELEVTTVEEFLASTGDDEPLHWEAKSVSVTPDHVRHAVTAFANRDGGYLIIGARRDSASGRWCLPGVEFPGSEPRTWLSNIIRSSISPPPQFDVHAWELPNGNKAAVVQVQPNCGFLSMTNGRVYYRRPGESSYVENGAELQAIHNTVQYRSRGLLGQPHPEQPQPQGASEVPSTAEIATDRPNVIAALRRQIDREDTAGVNIYLSSVLQKLRSSLANGDESEMEDALDRLSDVAALAVSHRPEEPITMRAIKAMHEAFDLPQQTRPAPNTLPPERLYAGVLARARAVGALAVRLQHWTPLRELILHRPAREHSRLFRTWFRDGDVHASRAHLYTVGNNVLESSRLPLRLAAGHAMRLPSLRPDGVDDEDALITGVCQFDLFTNMIAMWAAHENAPEEAALPYYAAWDPERVRPAVGRIITDLGCRETLLPGIADDDLAALIHFVADRAEQASQWLGSWSFWSGFVEGKAQTFIAQHTPPS
jgi:hypothetical protein